MIRYRLIYKEWKSGWNAITKYGIIDLVADRDEVLEVEVEEV